MKVARTIVALALVAAAQAAQAASLAGEPVVFKSGSWAVHRGLDPMTDKVSCTGVHATGPQIQLSNEGFYVSVRGGVKALKVRYDDKPASPLRLATDMERKIRAVIFDQSSFQEVLNAKRLRMEVMTILDTAPTFDIDLTGIRDAYENIRAGCPSQDKVEKSNSACTDTMRGRLAAKGMKPAEIEEVCR